jgi:hypothetical protein
MADPNTPSHTHRIMKAMAIKSLQQQNPNLYDAKAVDTLVMGMMGIPNPQALFAAPKPPMQPPMDPLRLMELQLKQKQQEIDAAIAAKKADAEVQRLQLEAEKIRSDVTLQRQQMMAESVGWANEIAARERIASLKNTTRPVPPFA